MRSLKKGLIIAEIMWNSQKLKTLPKRAKIRQEKLEKVVQGTNFPEHTVIHQS